MEYLDSLNWRYAAKKMNGQKVPAEKLHNILEAINLAPTSMGLQPFHVIVVEDEELRKKLAPAMYNQPQITAGSAVVIFAAWDNVTEEHIDEYLRNTAKVRGIKVEDLGGFREMLMGAIKGRSAENLQQWSARQAYIALGVGVTAAAIEKVDTTPMEGFNPAAVDEVLGLKEKGLTSVVALALGYRDDSDHLAKAKKVRRAKEEFFTHYVAEYA